MEIIEKAVNKLGLSTIPLVAELRQMRTEFKVCYYVVVMI